MKKIGFVDYYINEWHANNYVGWIKEASEKLGEDFEVKYAFAELDKDPNEGMTTDEWCKKYGVQKCDSIDELCEKSDYIIVLAPSNPETHLRLAEPVLKYGKNTYIDKTFAPDFATANRIFNIAKAHGTKFFSSSALRYAPELENTKGAVFMVTTGGGSNFEEYIIHQTEMIIKTLGTDAKRVKSESIGDGSRTVYVEFTSGKRAEMLYAPDNSFTVDVKFADGKAYTEKVNDGIIFAELIKDMIRFFTDGKTSFDTAETLAVSRVREAAVKSSGNWIELL